MFLCVCARICSYSAVLVLYSTPEGQRTTFGSQSFHPVDLSEGLSSVACQGLPARTVTQSSDIDMCLLLLPALLVSFLRNPWQIQHDNVCIVPSLFIFVSIFSIFGHKDCNVWEGKVLTSYIYQVYFSLNH